MLTTLAPGKVNLCLLVGAPRATTGLHPLVSVVQPTRPRRRGHARARQRAATRSICPGVSGENLALTRARREFRALTGWDGPPQRITIAKRIPIAAGMAGGSSNAAAALILVSQASGIAIPPELPMALGADVPGDAGRRARADDRRGRARRAAGRRRSRRSSSSRSTPS